MKAVLIGVAITPFAIGAAIASAGAGHGTYVMAKLLFPYSMLLTRLTGDALTPPLLGLAFVQFPLYGFVVASFDTKRALRILSLMHLAFAGLCFTSLLPNFS